MSLSELVCDSEILGLERSSVESVTELQVNANTAATTSVPTIEPPEHEGELNYISKYFIQYVPVKKVQKASKRATGARVSLVMNVQRVFLNKMKREGEKRKKKKQGRLNESKKRKNEKKLLNRKQKKLLKERKRLLKRKKKLLRKGKRPQEKKPKNLPTSRVILQGNAKEPMLLI